MKPHKATKERMDATEGEAEPADLAEAIHAEAIERCPQQRKKREARRVLDILDQLDREGKIR